MKPSDIFNETLKPFPAVFVAITFLTRRQDNLQLCLLQLVKKAAELLFDAMNPDQAGSATKPNQTISFLCSFHPYDTVMEMALLTFVPNII